MKKEYLLNTIVKSMCKYREEMWRIEITKYLSYWKTLLNCLLFTILTSTLNYIACKLWDEVSLELVEKLSISMNRGRN